MNHRPNREDHFQHKRRSANRPLRFGFICGLIFITSCGGGGGSSANDNSATTNSSTPTPTISLSSNRESVALDGTVLLNWSTTNATNCTASGAWSGSRSTTGSETITITIEGENTFTLECSGAGGNTSQSKIVTGVTALRSTWTAGEFEDWSLFSGLCENPRTGNDPSSGLPWADVQGTTLDENNWLRSWSNDLYLWYSEITDRDPSNYDDPISYFSVLKTFATTESGANKDNYHYTENTEEWRSYFGSGVVAGYGARFTVLSASIPREVAVAYTQPNSPATQQSLSRGARILSIDGVDIDGSTESDVDTINAGLWPSELDETHSFVVRDLNSTETREITMTSTGIITDPVQFDGTTFETDSGKVGYMLFNNHIATAETQLIDAIDNFASTGITDLILDLRYNGGGYLAIANQLAYMIAGPSAAQGRVFSQTVFNNKHTERNPVTGETLTPTLFRTTAIGFDDESIAGSELPSLNLSRVYVITGSGTCSASESIINGLRGIGIEVIQIGSQTCGKPYGFYGFDNCGTTYLTIQFKGINDAGFGEYSDGFAPGNTVDTGGVLLPGCSVADDFDHGFGDTSEERIAAALSYRSVGECPSPSGMSTIRHSKTGIALQIGTHQRAKYLSSLINSPTPIGQ